METLGLALAAQSLLHLFSESVLLSNAWERRSHTVIWQKLITPLPRRDPERVLVWSLARFQLL